MPHGWVDDAQKPGAEAIVVAVVPKEMWASLGFDDPQPIGIILYDWRDRPGGGRVVQIQKNYFQPPNAGVIVYMGDPAAVRGVIRKERDEDLKMWGGRVLVDKEEQAEVVFAIRLPNECGRGVWSLMMCVEGVGVDLRAYADMSDRDINGLIGGLRGRLQSVADAFVKRLASAPVEEWVAIASRG